MTLAHPKINRRKNYSKNYKKCKRCGKLYNDTDLRGSSDYCKPCRPLYRKEYERERYLSKKPLRK